MKYITKFILVLFISFNTFAQSNFKIIVPNGLGSMSDTSVRAIVPILEKELKSNLSVINVPGASGLVGQLRVVESQDVEILIGNSTIALNQLNSNLKINIFEELEPIYGLTEGNTMIYVSSSSNINNLNDFKKYQNNNGRLIAGTSNITADIAIHQLSKQLNIPIELIPYKLQTDMTMNCVSNLIQFFIGPDGNSLYKSLVDSGKLKPIAVISNYKSHIYPEVKTIIEQGYSNIPTFSWVGFFIKKSTPLEVKLKLYSAIKVSMNSKDLKIWASKPENFNLFNIDGFEIRKIQLSELKYFEQVLTK